MSEVLIDEHTTERWRVEARHDGKGRVPTWSGATEEIALARYEDARARHPEAQWATYRLVLVRESIRVRRFDVRPIG